MNFYTYKSDYLNIISNNNELEQFCIDNDIDINATLERHFHEGYLDWYIPKTQYYIRLSGIIRSDALSILKDNDWSIRELYLISIIPRYYCEENLFIILLAYINSIITSLEDYQYALDNYIGKYKIKNG